MNERDKSPREKLLDTVQELAKEWVREEMERVQAERAKAYGMTPQDLAEIAKAIGQGMCKARTQEARRALRSLRNKLAPNLREIADRAAAEEPQTQPARKSRK
jgi:hypothetical protein